MDIVDKSNSEKALLDLAKRIRQARIEARLSQKDLGKVIGVSDKSISAYEQGRVVPSYEKLKKIADYTHRPLNYFTEEEESEATIVAKIAAVEKELEEIKKLLKKSK